METGEALGVPLRGHTGPVWSVVISSDDKHIVSGSGDSTVQVWDAKSGDAVGAPLRGHTQPVFSVAISPDGKCIVSASGDYTIRRWDVESRQELGAPLRGHTNYIPSVAITPDGRHVVSGSMDTTIRVWDAASGEALGVPIRGHTGAISSVAISPKGKWIVSGSLDRSIRVWDFESLHKSYHFTATKICFSPNLTYALCSEFTFSCLEDSCTPASLGPSEEGWVIGPEGRLLLWIPTSLYPAMHVPGNKLVISNDASELDLSRFAHGISWEMCRERDVVSPSS
ncbi:hypothetical protein AZE42_04596 [Rhizopogon vesiculosus]|uniref:Uncharacterized protein n=1 Tax=Rhizopogon vesiculosus TaxID=180088 RepID=A0A1J8QWV9_9AGAM|nr:hypothetical protein AZE42_04596 [Rhizopogon vesiculosus]